MNEMRGKYTPPSIEATAFNCPHCGALATQFWYTAHAEGIASKDKLPIIITPVQAEEFAVAKPEDKDTHAGLVAWARKMAAGAPFLERREAYAHFDLNNVAISRCFNCDDIAIWIHNRMLWPIAGTAPLPNSDLPEEIRLDYEEASAILNISPRGAAALLRLAIQKLCAFLGEKGKNIDADIASLVAKGLDVRVQQALDVVRVVGNNAVHPGVIDLKDDSATASKLFSLVNLIAERLISQPKHVSEMFESLPPSAKAAIAKRDGVE